MLGEDLIAFRCELFGRVFDVTVIDLIVYHDNEIVIARHDNDKKGWCV